MTLAHEALQPPELLILDRDGVVLEHVEPYILGWQDVRVAEGVLESLASVARCFRSLAVVTNQSPIERKLVDASFVCEVNAGLASSIRASSGHDATFYVCPHTAAAGCVCRKPHPTLLLQAITDAGVSPSRTWMIGDQPTDIEAALRAHLPVRIQLTSGKSGSLNPAATHVFCDLPAALASMAAWFGS